MSFCVPIVTPHLIVLHSRCRLITGLKWAAFPLKECRNPSLSLFYDLFDHFNSTCRFITNILFVVYKQNKLCLMKKRCLLLPRLQNCSFFSNNRHTVKIMMLFCLRLLRLPSYNPVFNMAQVENTRYEKRIGLG